jgi:hypothetical protein
MFRHMRGIAGLMALVVSGCASYSSLVDTQPDQTFTAPGNRADVAGCVHTQLVRDYGMEYEYTVTSTRTETHILGTLKGVIYGGTSEPLFDIAFMQASPAQTRVEHRGRKSMWGSSYMHNEVASAVHKCES